MHMSGVYERELRSVLAGERKGVVAITRSCTEVERARAMQVCQRPFLVVRAPGSGSEGTGDILALRGDMCMPIEVKSSKTSLSALLFQRKSGILDLQTARGSLHDPLQKYQLPF